MTLRHTGILVKNLRASISWWSKQGFKPVGGIEHLSVQKMEDANGNTLELVQGNWSNHIAVNWWRDENDNLIETVERRQGIWSKLSQRLASIITGDLT